MEEPVRSQARLDQTKRLSNAILRRTVVNVVLFMVIYLVLYGGFVTVFAICTSPKLIAAYHVLHRLREPRHPPCALFYFPYPFAHTCVPAG